LTEFLERISSDGRRVLEADLGNESPAGFTVVERSDGWERVLD
jgi:hypothetical protein